MSEEVQPTRKVLSDGELLKIMPNLSKDKREIYLPYLLRAMARYEINTPLRIAAFLAQIAHESAELKYMREIWGPTEAQKRYEPPSELAAKLGNTQEGDGFRFRGRGPIQLTGRSNYLRYGGLLGEDLVNDPELAELPHVAFRTAALYWKDHALNELADRQELTGGRFFSSRLQRLETP